MTVAATSMYETQLQVCLHDGTAVPGREQLQFVRASNKHICVSSFTQSLCPAAPNRQQGSSTEQMANPAGTLASADACLAAFLHPYQQLIRRTSCHRQASVYPWHCHVVSQARAGITAPSLCVATAGAVHACPEQQQALQALSSPCAAWALQGPAG